MSKIGFIGMGNMAQALCDGFIRNKAVRAKDVYAYAPHADKLKKNAEKIGFVPLFGVKEVAEKADIIVMACKPYQIEGVLSEIGDLLKGKALVSIAAGWDLETYEAFLDPSVRVQYVLPNTAVRVGEGIAVFEKAHSLKAAERKEIRKLFETVGTVEELPTHLMDIGTAICGCAGAYVDMFMEAYADAAVKYGIPRADAYRMVSQMVLGAAKLQQVTSEHPGVLKDAVCSPGGTTIRGVAALEEAGLRNACIYSVDAIMNPI
ncbi:MAG: pyrroline-5-carboxylate reductase [Lachnospiraceae bacterium]|nr:pyrroline-5-carboxylate reductase [Lachnospiraceae bacterium]